MEIRTIDIDGIGPVLFRHSQRARCVSITVLPSAKVRVAVPYRASFRNALDFVHRKKTWILKHLTIIRLRESEAKAIPQFSPDMDTAENRSILTRRLAQLAAKHGFTYNRVTIRCQRTRWGSCSVKNNISLNIKLILLPPELMDYVILHELVHTRKKGHDRAFWAELDKYIGNGKATASKLRIYSRGLL